MYILKHGNTIAAITVIIVSFKRECKLVLYFYCLFCYLHNLYNKIKLHFIATLQNLQQVYCI